MTFRALFLSLIVAFGAASAASAQPAASAAAATLLRQLNSADSVPARSRISSDPTWQALMSQNSRLAEAAGEAPTIDYDPECQCQDASGAYRMLSLTQPGAGLAHVRIRKTFPGEANAHATEYTVVLRQAGAVWRIWDVIEQAGSVRTRLTAQNACLRATPGPAGARRCFPQPH